MTGFEPEPKTYRLTFGPETGLEGLQVTMASITVAESNRMVRIMSRSYSRENADEALTDMEWSNNLFASKLLEWNLLHKGKKVPPTAKGIESQDRFLIAAINRAWQEAMVSIPAPLSDGSSGGETTEEATLDLENASKSPSN